MNTSNPFVGPRTFTVDESHCYFGREREARELYYLVASQRLVLFYAQSGAGKSSLLRTRLIPRLQENDYTVLPIARVGGGLPIGFDDVSNIYVFNLLLSLDQSDAPPERLAHCSMVDFMVDLINDEGDPKVSGDENGTPIHVLMIDQFEEIVTHHPHRWQERELFFRQLDEAMSRNPKLWVLLCFREDYLAAMDPFAPLLAEKMRSRYYMQRLGRDAALEAVSKPAEAFGRPFAPGCAELLVDQLREFRLENSVTGLGQFVEPVQLQVVCYQLWKNLEEQPPGPITRVNLEQAGDIDTALSVFYNNAVNAAVLRGGASEIGVRDWFEKKLITASGTRGTVHKGRETTGGLPNEMVHYLTDRFLLRPEYRAGETWFELIHDRMIAPILSANRSWLKKQEPLVRAAHAWNEGARSKAHLLAGRQLQELAPDWNPDKVTKKPMGPMILAAVLLGGALFALARMGFLGEYLHEQTRAITEFLIPGSGQ